MICSGAVGGRRELAAIKLFFADAAAVHRVLETLEGLGIKASAKNYGLCGAVWEISFWIPNARRD